MNATPDGLPTLSSGAHSPGDGKAYVMEYIAFLSGEPGTDAPKCTHPVLAYTVRTVNDHLPDSERHRLVPLIGRLFGTEPPADALEAQRLSVGLAIWSTEQVLHLEQADNRKVCEDALSAARAWVNDPSEQNANAAANAAARASDAATFAVTFAAAAAAYAAAYDANDAFTAYVATYTAHAATSAAHSVSNARVELLSGLIDEYDRLTGRTGHRNVTTADLADLRQRVDAANGGDRDE